VGGADVLVLGCGPIGLLAIAAAKAYGAASITPVDMSEYRLQLARQIRADGGLPPHGRPFGRFVDVVGGTPGNETAFATALPFVRRGGRIVFVSLPEHPFSIDITRYVVLNEITISGMYGRRINETWVQAERLLSTHGATVSKVLTHHLPLADF